MRLWSGRNEEWSAVGKFVLGFALGALTTELVSRVTDNTAYYPSWTSLLLQISPWAEIAVHTPAVPDQTDSADVTIITAFYDIGEFRKKQSWRRRNKQLYHEWMALWAFVENNVVAYFDDPESAAVFRRARGFLPTEIRIFDRYSLPSFKQLDNVTKIISRPGYPELHPETSTPEYSCVQNLKYDVVELALTHTAFQTPVYGWLDIGTFNYHVNRIHRSFRICLPDDADVEKVLYTQVDPYNEDLIVEEVFTQRRRWLGGGAFFGRRDILLEWTQRFRHAVHVFLERGLVCSDQALLYGMTLPTTTGGLGWAHLVQPMPMKKWHDRGYALVYLYETTWRYPLKMCTEQIDTSLHRCLNM